MSNAATWSILLVDDDEVVLTLIGNTLESRGLDVVSACGVPSRRRPPLGR